MADKNVDLWVLRHMYIIIFSETPHRKFSVRQKAMASNVAVLLFIVNVLLLAVQIFAG